MPFHLEMLRSGSSGNCAILTAGKTRLLIDAGIGPRVLAKELAARGLALRDLSGAIFTHCHSDHLRGNTIALLAREGVPIHLNEGTWEVARTRTGNQALDALPGHLVRLFAADARLEIQDLEIQSFRVSHGLPGRFNPAGDPVGFAMTDGTDVFGYCTDVGTVNEAMLDCLRRADLLVLESNHDVEMERMSPRPYQTKQWILGDTGHLNNVQAAEALATLFENREGGAVVLAHLSEMCNTVGLARETTRERLAGLCDIQVGVANRLHATPAWELVRGRARQLETPLGCFAGLEAYL
jgi:phosphoribosyl 1,2-cyclic phosphodiesterase